MDERIAQKRSSTCRGEVPEAETIFHGLGYYPQKFMDNVADRLEELRAESRDLLLALLESSNPSGTAGRRRLANLISAACEDLVGEAIARYAFALDQMTLADFRSQWVDLFVERCECFFRAEYFKLAGQIPGMPVELEDGVAARMKAQWIKRANKATERAFEISSALDGSIHNLEEQKLLAQIRIELALEDAAAAAGLQLSIAGGAKAQRQIRPRSSDTKPAVRSYPPAAVHVPAPFPIRATWLADRLYERGWDKHELQRHRGPDHKTTQKVLDGLAVGTSVLEKIAAALSMKFGKLTMENIPKM